MPAPYIHDGYTLEALVPLSRRRRDGLHFVYRPLLCAEAQRRLSQINRLSALGSAAGDTAAQISIGVLADQLVAWDLIDGSARLREISPAVIATLEKVQLQAIFTAVFALDRDAEAEAADARNLTAGVRLLLNYPQIAARDCRHCQQFAYDESTGQPCRNRSRSGEFVPRPAGNLPPCRIEGVGCPKGTPEQQNSLNEKNRQAYRHYLECRATGIFPDDPIVRRNAVLIRAEEDRVGEARWNDLRRLLTLQLR